MENGRYEQTHHTQGQERGTGLRDGRVVDLLPEPQTAEEEAHAEDQEDVSQYRAHKRRLNDSNLILAEGDYEDDQLDSIAKGDIHQSPHGIAHSAGYTLRRMAEQTGEWNNCNSVDTENHACRQMRETDSKPNWDKDE